MPEFRPGEQGNMANQWDRWIKTLNAAWNLKRLKDDYKSESGQIISKKRALLLAIGGPQLREVFATLKAEEGTYSEAKERITE